MTEGNAEAARELVSVLRKSYPDVLDDAEVKQVVSAIDLMGAAPGSVEPLLARLKENPNGAVARDGCWPWAPPLTCSPADHQVRHDLASAYFAAGAPAKAIDEALELLKRDRSWNEGAAKALLLKFFDVRFPDRSGARAREVSASLDRLSDPRTLWQSRVGSDSPASSSCR